MEARVEPSARPASSAAFAEAGERARGAPSGPRDRAADVRLPRAAVMDFPPEAELALRDVHHDRIACLVPTREDLLRERVLEVALDGALERARAVRGVEADVAEEIL